MREDAVTPCVRTDYENALLASIGNTCPNPVKFPPSCTQPCTCMYLPNIRLLSQPYLQTIVALWDTTNGDARF